MSAKRSALQVCARKLAASEAPCAPSFQPLNAATSTGAAQGGPALDAEMPCDPPSLRQARRAARARCGRPARRRRPDRRGERHVDEDEPPGQPFAPLDLADGHLDEQEAEHRRRRSRARPRARPRSARSERQQRQEPDAEDGRGADVDVQRLDDVARNGTMSSPPGMRAGGGDERAARRRARAPRGRARARATPTRAATRRSRRARSRGALDDDDRDRERDEGEQEVAHDDQRVELEEDGDPAQDSLGEDGERKRATRAPEEPAGQAAATRKRGDRPRRASRGRRRSPTTRFPNST